jgi:hypothetical protein
MGLGEADTRAKLIDPALHARGWTEDLIRREETAGAVEIVAGRPRRRARGRIDYTLRVTVGPGAQPVAVALIEAKAEDLPPTHGLEQAKAYAACKRLNVPFVFASNGHRFVEFDRFTGRTGAVRLLAEFPRPADLRARYEKAVGFSLDDAAARPLVTRYSGGEEGTRRYYQDAAVRAVLEKLARGDKRALLSLATGAGKTRIAVNLLKRIADAGQRPLHLRSGRAAQPGPGRLPERLRGGCRGRRLRQPPEERAGVDRHVPDARRRSRGRLRQLPGDTLPGELLQPHRHRRVPPLGVGQVVAGTHAQSRSCADRPHGHAPPP